MADKASGTSLVLSDHLPKLGALVATEIATLKKTPVDKNLFLVVFFACFIGILTLGVAVPRLFAPASVVANVKDQGAGNAMLPEKKQTKDIARPVTASNERQAIAIANNDKYTGGPLGPAPVPELEEPFGRESLPRIGADGRTPWFTYSRPFDKTDPRPRIFVIVGELGLSRLISETAINTLPDPVTLAFSSAANAADAWMLRARGVGHETLLSIPAEPLDYPLSDPGPEALLVQNRSSDNVHRLAQHMSDGKGYVGVMSFSGSRFSGSNEAMRPILEEIKKRGLFWVDAKTAPQSVVEAVALETGTLSAKVDFLGDENLAQIGIDGLFKAVEDKARADGAALLLVPATPLLLSRLSEWLKTLPAKGLALAPISAAVH